MNYKKGFLKLLFFSFIIISSSSLYASKFVAKASGNWSDISSWNLNMVPTANDTVYIDGFTINIDTKVELKHLFLTNTNNTNSTVIVISDTLTVLNGVSVVAENKGQHVDVLVNGDAVFTVHGNVSFVRAADNNTNKRLQFYMYGNSKTYFNGDFEFDYKNASVSEVDFDIYTAGSALFEVRGQTNLITRNGKDLDFVLQGNSNVILRDSLSLLLIGGEETAITADGNSHFQLLASAYLLNSAGSNHTKLKAGDAGGKMTITGNVYMHSLANNMKVKLEAKGTNAELNIAGDIVMTATSDQSLLIDLKDTGKLNFGGNILRPSNYGALAMSTDGKLVLNGTEPQFMPVGNLPTSGVDSLYFGTVSLENTSGKALELTEDMIIKDSIILTDGNIVTSSGAKLILEEAAKISGADADAYVEGPMTKIGASSGISYTFPVGDEDGYAPLTITPESNLSTAEYTVQYYSDPPPFGAGVGLTIDNVSSSEYWEVSKSTGTPKADITLSWTDAEAQGIQNLNDLIVVGLNPSTNDWDNYGNGGTTGGTGSGASGTIINALSSDPPPFGVIFFTLGSTSALNSLPVELTSFQAVQIDEHVHIEWETASERNTSHFEIERSVDGFNFEKIERVNGNGDGIITVYYSTKDESPENGISYYRLKIVDNDGTYEYSNIEVVNFEEEPTINLFPNPVKKTIQIEGIDSNTDNAILEIFDRNGQIIYINQISFNDGKFQISTESANIYNPGTYFLRITSQGNSHVLKFMKVN